MAQGTIKKIVADRGFGFIAGSSAERGNDIFFHLSSVEGVPFEELHEGQSVEYDLAEDDGRGRNKGPRAGTVRIV